MSTKPLTVYVGYDAREHDAYEVCVHSLLRHSSISLNVVRLDQSLLRYVKLYDRPFRLEKGQKIDERDGKPFSTDFSFTRFLVPALSLYEGWAVFMDCDFLITQDIAKLMEYADERFGALVVKHDYTPFEAIKMDGQIQSKYRRKNWSSFILWNCSHQLNRFLTVDAVNHEPGSWLHGFEWLTDNSIGTLPKRWNWLSCVDKPLLHDEVPSAIHFTLGTPDMPGWETSPYADLWTDELRLLRQGRKLHTTQLRAIA